MRGSLEPLQPLDLLIAKSCSQLQSNSLIGTIKLHDATHKVGQVNHIVPEFKIYGHLTSSLSMSRFLDADLFELLPEESLALPNFLIGLFSDIV